MCNVSESFKFCTCAQEDPGPGAPGSKLPSYTWWLTRYAGKDDSGVTGSIVGPSQDLGAGVTTASIIDVLNSGHAFDFSYQPEDNDSLRVSLFPGPQGYQYMSFLFVGGIWVEGMNPPFTTRLREIAKGDVYRKN